MRRWALILCAVALFGAGAARDGFDAWVDRTVLPVLVTQTGAEVRDRQGRLLRAYTVADGRWRLAVSRDAVDAGFIRMLVAYEDKRFWQHSGVDMRAMLRAVGQMVWHGRVLSGGSTLTMQVARLLEESGTGHWRGKLRQMRVAWALERRLEKGAILDLYLARAPYGGNIEGVRAASLAYFGKEPARLTPAQSALLVAIPQSPEARRPDGGDGRAARDRVLARIGMAPSTEPMPVGRKPFASLAPHLADRMVRDAPLLGLHRTTLDREIQEKLEILAARAAEQAGEQVSVAMIVADHSSGEVLAHIGSAGYRADGRQGFVDMTRALRSPGSTLKPLVYGMAFDEGLAHPETLIDDRRVAFGSYAPVNFDHRYRGTVRVREALQMSLNIPVVALTEALGPVRLIAAMRRAGMEPVMQGGTAGLAVALGGVGVTLEDLVQLYSSLAQGGRVVPLRFGARQEAERDTSVGGRRVISARAAWQVAHILGGIAPPPHAPRQAIAYKTGTSYGHRDAWAIGFDGRHVIGVWLGRADGTPVPGAFGGELAAPVLFEAFSRVKNRAEPLPPPPAGVLLLANADLPRPLQRFGQAELGKKTGPEIAFPPDGAEVERDGTGLVVKLRDGLAPFTWLINGAPVAAAGHRREVVLPDPGPGYTAISVIDAAGQADRLQVFLR